MINKEFIPYEQALALKELGFDEPCILLYRGLDTQPVCQMDYEFKTEKNSDYNDETNYWLTVPTYSQAFRWFREKYFIHHEIGRDFDTWDYELYDFKSGNKHIPTGFKTFNTYEEAELECLKKLIEIVKNKNNE
jgi:hypothetical protein